MKLHEDKFAFLNIINLIHEQKLYHAVEGRKAEKLFSLIYGLSLTIMKDIQGVFWGCPRIEALF